MASNSIHSCAVCGKLFTRSRPSANKEKFCGPDCQFRCKVDRRSKDECWSWLAAKNTAGYGVMRLGGENVLAHRVAWVLANGPFPEDDLDVLHHCDNPLCCNPSHLSIGSHADNMADMSAKERARRPGRK